jgi:hypothetical protein
LLPDLYKKYEDLFDKTASQSVFFPLFAHDMKKIKHDSNWLFRMLKCSLGPSLLKQDKNSNGQSLHCNIPPDQTVTNI